MRVALLIVLGMIPALTFADVRCEKYADRAALKAHAKKFVEGKEISGPSLFENAKLLHVENPGEHEIRLYTVRVADEVEVETWYVLVRTNLNNKACYILSATFVP